MKRTLFIIAVFYLGFASHAQIVNIPDANFKAKLLLATAANQMASTTLGAPYNKIDTNNNGEIEVSEAEQIHYLNISAFDGENLFSSLEGINSFTNLVSLICNHQTIAVADLNLPNLTTLALNNNLLQTIDLSHLQQLTTVQLGYNQLSVLDVSSLTNLEQVNCIYNPGLVQLNLGSVSQLTSIICHYCAITSLDLSHLPQLDSLYCFNNALTSLNVSQCPLLHALNFSNNQISEIDATNLTLLWAFVAEGNPIATLDFSQNPHLYSLNCDNTLLTTLDVSQNAHLQYLNCSNNPLLQSIFAKNGKNETFNFSGNPNLQYICADEGQIINIQTRIATYGYTNCHTNSYCSFTPGGTFYTIQGETKYDHNGNGCDTSDILYPHLKIGFTNGIDTTVLIPDDSGDYHYDVQEGAYTLTPMLENPSYFVVSPPSATITFPTDASPFAQDFCVAANGIHNDLSVVALPLFRARPGTDTLCKLIYSNNGTQAQSGTVTFNFEDAVLDLVVANPPVSNQSPNVLSWNFTNLQPFESVELYAELNLNSPVETPPLNAGDILHYTAAISGSTDETPADNVVTIEQPVVNTYDPNDKICLEGAMVSTDVIGRDVHYMIHFENNGTAEAQNIVVKDIIDTDKFDMTTFVPIDGSHPFVTKISETNKVEFIFENINLAFDDNNNDGYVAFKIKTKTTLVPGDSFTNAAKIYFDYNFPIDTNTAVTTIQTLSNQDFEFSSYFTLFPNPAKDKLNIHSKEGTVVNSVSIYNMLGQLIFTAINPDETIDVSNLSSGNYFIKALTDIGSGVCKFIKE